MDWEKKSCRWTQYMQQCQSSQSVISQTPEECVQTAWAKTKNVMTRHNPTKYNPTFTVTVTSEKTLTLRRNLGYIQVFFMEILISNSSRMYILISMVHVSIQICTETIYKWYFYVIYCIYSDVPLSPLTGYQYTLTYLIVLLTLPHISRGILFSIMKTVSLIILSIC